MTQTISRCLNIDDLYNVLFFKFIPAILSRDFLFNIIYAQ